MIRTILTMSFVVLFLLLSSPLMFIEWLVGKKDKERADRHSLAIVNWAFRVIKVLAGVKLEVRGREKIPTDTSVLYIANHRGMYDIVLGYPLVAGPTGFISKIEVLKVPLLRVWMKRLNCLFLDRSSMKAGLNTILAAIEQVKCGISVWVFPEGTRQKDLESTTLLPFHDGTFKIATKSNHPIIPVTFVGTRQILDAHMPFTKSGKVIVEFGDPIYPDRLDKEDLKNIGDYTKNIIEATYQKNIAGLLPEK